MRLYPYGLKHDRCPDEVTINDLDREVYELSRDLGPGRCGPTGSSPPPPGRRCTTRCCKFPRTCARAGATSEGGRCGQLPARPAGPGRVQRQRRLQQNRLVERHEACYGAYWKSYDFRTSDGPGQPVRFPLGPVFEATPFDRQAFRHDGGEIIFNLPNGLQGYLLVDGKERRIDAGPMEVVSDSKQTSGTPLVVNGLSCMACHRHGMIRFKDQVRDSHILGGEARDRVRQLYPVAEEMDRLVARDEKRFLDKLDEALGPFLKVADDARKDIRDFTEPISAIGRWYLVQELTLADAARELGLEDGKSLQGIIQANPRLQELGLYPLTKGHTIKREVWESLEFITAPFQEAARELKLGTPVRQQ